MKPCPYCGADTRISTHKSKTLSTAQVKCKRQSCGMSGPLWKGEDSRKRAQEHWENCYFHPTMRLRKALIAQEETA